MILFSQSLNKSQRIHVCWHETEFSESDKLAMVEVFTSGMSTIRSYKPCESLEAEAIRAIEVVESGSARLLKAVVDGQIVGFALFPPETKVGEEIQQRISLLVANCSKKKDGTRVYPGVGSALRDFVVKEYDGKGIILTGNVKLENKVARTLYQKWGAVELEPGQTYNNADPGLSIGVKFKSLRPF